MKCLAGFVLPGLFPQFKRLGNYASRSSLAGASDVTCGYAHNTSPYHAAQRPRTCFVRLLSGRRRHLTLPEVIRRPRMRNTPRPLSATSRLDNNTLSLRI